MSRVYYTNKAQADVDSISEYYTLIDLGLCDKFQEEIGKAQVLISDFPDLYRIRHKDVRRVNLHSFPFCIFYRFVKRRIFP